MISIKNVYYLLLYAWDMFGDGDMAAVDAEPESDLLDLLANVLTRGIDRLLRRGLDRGFLPIEDEIPGIRGKLDLSATVKMNVLPRARTMCRFDELNHDVIQNRILKTTLRQLLRTERLDPEVREQVRIAYVRMPSVREIRLSERVFHNVQLHRNIRYYRFLIDVCRLLYDHLIPDESRGTFRFRDFSRDEVRMRRLFERFLYSFYKCEQDVFKVASRRFPWASARSSLGMLPSMLTDVTLTRGGRSLIIDAKYSPKVLQKPLHGTPTLRSEHLYQLFAYIRNFPTAPGTIVDGLLLYPLGRDLVDVTFDLSGHTVRVYTIDLNQHWRLIHRELLGLIDPVSALP